MMVHIFKSKKPAVAYTKDTTGDNLPEDHGPWTHVKVTEIKRGDDIVGDDSEKIIADIDGQGYHLSTNKAALENIGTSY